MTLLSANIPALLASAIAVLYLGCPPAAGAEPDPDPRRVLERMFEFYAALPAVRTEIVCDGPVAVVPGVAYEVAAARPNLFALRLPPQVIGEVTQIVSDGAALYTLARWTPAEAVWDRSDPPDTLGALLQRGESMLTPAGSMDLYTLLPLLAGTAEQEWLEGVTKVRYAGTGTVGGAACHRVGLVEAMPEMFGGGEGITWYWIDAGPKPWLRMVVMPPLGDADSDPATFEAQAAPGGEEAPPAGRGLGRLLQRIGGHAARAAAPDRLIFRSWSDAPVPDGVFTFEPPPGAKRVEGLFAAGPEPRHPSIGKPLAGIRLDLADGGEVQLPAEGRVVVLDFWASWCAPCVATLPTVAATAAEFADRGVVFYAVNVWDKPEAAQKAVARLALDAAIAYDAAGEAAKALGITAIPHTLVIDAKGTVHAVHVGAAGDVARWLRESISAAIGGEDSADPERRR